MSVVQRRQCAAVIEAARSLCTEANATRSRSREILARSRLLPSREPRCPVGRERQQAAKTVLVARPPAPDGSSPATVYVVGEFDMAAVPAVSAKLEAHLYAAVSGTTLVVDLCGVTFIDLRGLRLLLSVTAAARSRGVSVELVGRPRCLLRLLEITGVAEGLNLR